MNFKCKELEISDEELGCTISFSDSISADDQFKTIEEIMNLEEKYFIIQRAYPEDDCELDYYYLETSETDTAHNSDDTMTVVIERERFEINWSGVRVEIGLNLTDKEFYDLKEILESRFKDRIRIKK